jgi:transposase
LLATRTPAGMGPAVTLPGAVDRPAFETFRTQGLVPSLRPAQSVLLDHHSVRTSARARAAIDAAGGHLRFLPRDSPDFTPIEQAFAKRKPGWRRSATRDFEAIVAATGQVRETITAGDARRFFAAAGFLLPEQRI